MDLKSNFSQAVKELTTVPGKQPQNNKTAAPKVQSKEPAPAKAADDSFELTLSSSETDAVVSPALASLTVPAEPEFAATVIADGTHLNGELEAKGNVTINGTMEGNVTTKKSFTLSGLLKGNASVGSCTISNGSMKGNLTAASSVIINTGSVIVGDIQADSVQLDGKVKGNLLVKDFLFMGKDAVVIGSVSAARVSVLDGAIIHGDFSITTRDTSKDFEALEK